MIPSIKIEDYNYPLPDERIAKYPLAERDASKLLRYENGDVCEYIFKDIPSLLPSGSLMIFNDTKVVPARLHFQRETGAHIEIFCLEPVNPPEYNTAFAATERCRWKCVIGNAKRWKNDVLSLYNPDSDEAISAMGLKASLVERNGETGIVEFSGMAGSLSPECWNGAAQSRFLRISIVRQNRLTQSAIRPCMLISAAPWQLLRPDCISRSLYWTISPPRALTVRMSAFTSEPALSFRSRVRMWLIIRCTGSRLWSLLTFSSA